MVDGYKLYKIHTVSYATSPPTITDKEDYYNHINWGWGGIGNGYFLDHVFAPNNAFLYDDTASVDLVNYNNSVQFFEIYR